MKELNVELYDITRANVANHNTMICLEQNGFLLCTEGEIVLKMDDALFNIRKGDLYIYPAFSQTQVVECSGDFVGIAGIADFDFVLTSLESIFDTQSQVYIRFHPHTSLTSEQYDRILNLLNLIKFRKNVETKLLPKILSSLVQAFCYEVVDAYVSNMGDVISQSNSGRKDKVFQKFLVDLHKNFRLSRSVSFYAARQGLTPRYFTTLIHDVSGKTPLQWISLFVIAEAKHLLTNSKLSIKEISNLLNFSEQSFFGRYFKQYAGCSPGEYRTKAISLK